MPCYAVLYMPCRAVLCCPMLCYAVLYYPMLCHAVLCCAMPCSPTCKGKGAVSESKEVVIRVPSGVESGTTLRVSE